MNIDKSSIEEIIKLSDSKIHSDIAKLFNVHASTIGRILRKNNINTNKKNIHETSIFR